MPQLNPSPILALPTDPAPLSFEEFAVKEHHQLATILEDVAVLTQRESFAV